MHNGIIENYGEIKARWHTFLSETDTEVMAHLIQDELENGAGSLMAATRAASK